MFKSHVEKHKGEPQSNFDFKMMSAFFSIRDIFKKPKVILENADIKVDDYVLDYGCGPGSYSMVAAELVGPNGQVFAVDRHPLAIKKVNKKAVKRGLNNITTIQTNCKTDLKSCIIDVIFCFDTFHSFTQPKDNLSEFHRILKNNGALYIMDTHLFEDDLILSITGRGLFEFSEKRDEVYKFIKSN
ncbi:MAG: class I SAM-dependent methyltransferase [Promethearchaeota archaeon]|nr:MAG: class I SAM-dependent methyltransferase [Candidatus Lokiarchaeota archaeon]